MRLVTSAAILVLCAAFGTTAADANESALAKARITSVVFANLESAAPVVTIKGTGFGARPRPNPLFRPTPPQGNSPPYGCTATGNVGWDYGTQLWVAFIAQGGRPLWSAGRYRPKLQELDCVGLTGLKYSDNLISFRFGAGYRALGLKLPTGALYTVSVKGVTKRGTIP